MQKIVQLKKLTLEYFLFNWLSHKTYTFQRQQQEQQQREQQQQQQQKDGSPSPAEADKSDCPATTAGGSSQAATNAETA
jgi:hypothetical protein